MMSKFKPQLEPVTVAPSQNESLQATAGNNSAGSIIRPAYFISFEFSPQLTHNILRCQKFIKLGENVDAAQV